MASAISKGPPFPYSFGDRVERVSTDKSIWILYNGTRREDGADCSILSFDISANKSRLPLARNALKKLRTLRHPGVLKVLDAVETDTYIYIATERVAPLIWHTRLKRLSVETIKWGLFTIAKTVKFINEEASSVHGNLRVSSIYTSQSGEWKLDGFELLSSMKEDDAIIYSYANREPLSDLYLPPEVVKGGWDAIKRQPVTAVDSYAFGLLIYEAFTGDVVGSDTIGDTRKVPPSMHQSYKRLLNANPKARLSVGHFLEQGLRSGGFFETPLIRLTEGIESLDLKTDSERQQFLGELDEVPDDFPEDFLKTKVLPELLKSVEFGGGGPKVFAAVMKLSAKLTEDEYQTHVTPVVVRLFAIPDRAIRVCLLDNLSLMIEHLPQKVVNDKIFPQMVSGFTDVAPVVREQTVKAVLTVVPKLSDRTTNGELLKYLARTANDEQPGIRTNTTICLGKIARNLGSNTRQKILAAAFTRSLRDPFVHARNAALMALAATADVFTNEDCATRLLPAMCPSLIDKEKLVRDQANKTLDIYLQRVRAYGATLPDTILSPANPGDARASSTPRMGTAQNDTSWAGWAISSFTNKLASARGDIEPRPAGDRALSEGSKGGSASIPSVSSKLASPASASTPVLDRKALGSSVRPTTNAPISTTNSFDEEESILADEAVDAWAAMEDFDDSPTAPKQPQESTEVFVPYDDSGEPDFAGWLAAQSQSKTKKALPKGLSKKPENQNQKKPVAASRAITTGSIESTVVPGRTSRPAATPSAAKSTSQSTVTKTVDTRPKDDGMAEEDHDAWGAEWE
ncbi:MAG: hypothetical protein M1816_007462 [Peltula sp. TS41687]|nr:MAG: hypothetical protein M1816_007462 [Peltula sp. TS41687]